MDTSHSSIGPWWLSLLPIIPLVIAAVVVAYVSYRPTQHNLYVSSTFSTLTVQDARSLQRLYQHENYTWPPHTRIPAIILGALPTNMTALDTTQRKALFLRILLPIIIKENLRIAHQRAFVQHVWAVAHPTPAALAKVTAIARHYKVDASLEHNQSRQRLLRRLNTVPVTLVLAQAAIESGWGTSRFAQQGNNLFGVWTWSAQQGLAPRLADANTAHFVRRYPSLSASVRGYLYTINVGRAYRGLRLKRAQLRHRGQTVRAVNLISALNGYSERGLAYLHDLKTIIRTNGLAQLDARQWRLQPIR